MVIRRCKDGTNQIDWVKSLAIIGVFGGIILWCIQVATSADKKSETAMVIMQRVEHSIERLETKIDNHLAK